EGTARFTLDGMPVKKMSIDADSKAGVLDEKTGRKRRKELQQEADFYGSRDGENKFVKGDAIEGLIVTAINIIGGIVIVAVMLNMTLMGAAQTYVRLTVGHGLVSQIPALLISTSADINVTRASND
ncbi:EscV/YscV/HrcV family type III secretion system export apparatus protein, partial [Clostridioides difficile]|uniref:FHIPEP family type III secretion protein n=1 Tax=Clostridioides difficile TaxID=1496 RepID=UPI000BD39074